MTIRTKIVRILAALAILAACSIFGATKVGPFRPGAKVPTNILHLVVGSAPPADPCQTMTVDGLEWHVLSNAFSIRGIGVGLLGYYAPSNVIEMVSFASFDDYRGIARVAYAKWSAHNPPSYVPPKETWTNGASFAQLVASKKAFVLKIGRFSAYSAMIASNLTASADVSAF